MESITSRNFGLLIAFLIPGFIGIAGLGYLSGLVQSWLRGPIGGDSPTIGGFLYATLASVFVGLFVSTIRWLIIDAFLQWTGVHKPNWKLRRLSAHHSAFRTLVEDQYRYYQFYGNSLVAITFYCLARWSTTSHLWLEYPIALGVAAILFLGARDTLSKYYRRGEEFLR